MEGGGFQIGLMCWVCCTALRPTVEIKTATHWYGVKLDGSLNTLDFVGSWLPTIFGGQCEYSLQLGKYSKSFEVKIGAPRFRPPHSSDSGTIETLWCRYACIRWTA